MKPTKYKYYNNETINHIRKLIDANKLEEALASYINYIELYPKDYEGKAYYIDILIKLGRFEEAKEAIDEMKFSYKYDIRLINKIKLMKVKLLVCEGKFEEAYEFVQNNIEDLTLLENIESYFLIFLRKKLNLLTEEDFNQPSYLLNQILNYSEERCLKHLVKHQSYEGNENACQFGSDFPLKEVYLRLRQNLPEQGRIYSSLCDYRLIFKYNNNGRVNGRMTDFFTAVVLHHSNDIITMYPYLNTEKWIYTDITPPDIEVEGPKLKRMSQIDKFNQRYQKMNQK